MILFLVACTDQPSKVTEKENEVIVKEIPKTEPKHQVGQELPLLERIEIQMNKDVNTIDKIFQGQLDNREIGFATFMEHEEYVNEMFSYKISSTIQSELLEFLKPIEVEIVEREFYKRETEFDFRIVRSRYSWLDSFIAVDLENKTLMISGGELVFPNLYKVRNSEEEVFKRLVEYFQQSEKVESN